MKLSNSYVILVMVVISLIQSTCAADVSIMPIDETPVPTPKTPPQLMITADTSKVYVGELKTVVFTVNVESSCNPSSGEVCPTSGTSVPLSDANVHIQGAATGGGVTNGQGQLVMTINAADTGIITAIASKSGYIDGSITISVENKPKPPPSLEIIADTLTVNIGESKSVTFTVTTENTCDPSAGQACPMATTDQNEIPISDVNVHLEGCASGNGMTDSNGNTIITVNANCVGIITAIASKSGYVNGKVTIDVKNPSIPAPNLIDVSIISKPAGANIFINDVYKGNAPKTIKLTEGTYNLRADLAGYKSTKTDFKITSDMVRQDISIILEPIENSRFRVGPTVRIRPLNDVINKSSDGLVELYMDNPSLNDVVLKVDARISVPAGIHVYGQGFGEAATAGTVYGVFEVPPGKARTVYIRFKADRTGDFTAQFSGTYYPGDNKDAYQPISLTHLFKVYEINQPGNISTPIITIPPTDIIPVTNKRAILQVTYNIEKSDNGAIVTIKINNIGDDVARFVSLSTTIPSELNPILLSGANNKDGEIVWKGDIGINEEHDIKISVKPVKTDIELPVKVTYVKDSVTANKIMTAAAAKGVDVQFIPIDPINLEIILLLIKIAKELPGFGIMLGIGGILTIYLFRRLKVRNQNNILNYKYNELGGRNYE